jgi:hypothetical protein
VDTQRSVATVAENPKTWKDTASHKTVKDWNSFIAVLTKRGIMSALYLTRQSRDAPIFSYAVFPGQLHRPIVKKTVTAKRAVTQNAEKNPVESAITPAMTGRIPIPR